MNNLTKLALSESLLIAFVLFMVLVGFKEMI